MNPARPFVFVFSLILASSCLQARTQEAVASDQPASETMRVSLNGKWKLFYFPQGKYQITQPDQLRIQGLSPIEASVPGNVELDLSRKGELPADLV